MKFLRPLARHLGPGAFRNAFRSSPVQPVRIGIRFNSSKSSIVAEMETVDTTQRLQKLRQLMKERKVDVYSM